jgi:riboflavin synthase
VGLRKPRAGACSRPGALVVERRGSVSNSGETGVPRLVARLRVILRAKEARMFTGIVEETATVVSTTREGAITRLTLRTALDLTDTRLGDSIAVDGVCLTVTALSPKDSVSFDVGPESLRVTSLGRLRTGSRVHVERALRVGDRLGGHIVQGHVDGTGVVRETRSVGDTLIVEIEAPREVTSLIIHKGSITVSGVSLTVNAVTDDGFSVWLIPHTLERTHLASLQVGDLVNLENDVIGKYVERLLKGPGKSGGVTFELLREKGFISDEQSR